MLQATYFEKVKCIYIDPPYNTTNDFIYPDDYTESKKAYWEKNGTVKDGVKLVANSEASGRKHSNWLNMMQSRLLLARQLLRQDGLLFISIDDNEMHHLRKICDEIFGEENFVNCIAVKLSEATGVKMSHADTRLPKTKEYILFYRKSSEIKINPIKIPNEKWNDEYKKIITGISRDKLDEIKDIIYQESSTNKDLEVVKNLIKGAKITSLSSFFDQNNIVEMQDKDDFKWENAWRIVQAVGAGSLKDRAIDARIIGQDISTVLSSRGKLSIFKTQFNCSSKDPRIRILFADNYLSHNPGDFWQDIKTAGGVALEGGVAFPNGKKPLKLLKRIIFSATSSDENDISMDFFAGSGSFGHAVIELNAEDNGNRQFILVQVPEYTEGNDEIKNTPFRTISELCIERMKISSESTRSKNDKVDVGFRVYRLTDSHFPENLFKSDPDKSDDQNMAALKAHLDTASQSSLFQEEELANIITEISLKNGYGLFFTLEQLEAFAGNTVYRLTGNGKDTLLCLDDTLKDDTIEELAAKHSEDQLIVTKRALDTAKTWTLQNAFNDNLRIV